MENEAGSWDGNPQAGLLAILLNPKRGWARMRVWGRPGWRAISPKPLGAGRLEMKAGHGPELFKHPGPLPVRCSLEQAYRAPDIL